MRITFKLRPRETGLRAVGAGPRSSAINVNGVEVGSVSALGGGWSGAVRGWYFAANFNGAYVNTCNAPAPTVEDAKAAARAWLLANEVPS